MHLGRQLLGCPCRGCVPLTLALAPRHTPEHMGTSSPGIPPRGSSFQDKTRETQLHFSPSINTKTPTTLSPGCGCGRHPPACKCGISHRRESPLRCYPLLQGLNRAETHGEAPGPRGSSCCAPGKCRLLFPEDLARVYSGTRPDVSWGRGRPWGG